VKTMLYRAAPRPRQPKPHNSRRQSARPSNAKHQRRQILSLAIGAAAIPVISRIATAQTTYPSRPITMIVPAAAGGATDVTARIVAEHMSRALGQQVVIENIPGAGGTIGSTRAMRASPDGYTIEMGLTLISQTPSVYGAV
jgi:tripartite-type tricarboxylate transporter receptor subunit TctC